jgi:AcrR family transcriptional regulator
VATVAAPPRGRPRSQEADSAITRATLELLAEVGYSRLTMAGVAERAGVSTATLYRRVSSKEDLVVGALAAMVPDRAPVDTGSLQGDLTATLTRSAETLSGSRGRLLLGMTGETVRHPLLAEAVRARLAAPFRDNLAAMLMRAVERGEIPEPDDLDLAVSVVLGPLHYRLLVSDDALSTDLVERLVPMLVRALQGTPR